jgi:hypothetical protein
MPKLTDTQFAILSTAAQRDDGVVLPLAGSLAIKGAAVATMLDALCKKGFLEEKAAARRALVWRKGPAGRRMTLVITEAGRQAVGGEPAEEPSKLAPARHAPAKGPRRRAQTGKAASKTVDGNTAGETREGTKQALLIQLLKRKTGATIAEIAEATSWQTHSVRGAISGALKKKLGLPVTAGKVEGRGRVYRITGRS